MSADLKPSTWFGAGYTVASHVAGFLTDSASSNKVLTEVLDADADPTTGDIRKLMYAICEAFNTAWAARAVDPTNLPHNLRFTKSIGSGPGGAARITYSFAFINDIVSTPVADE